jgi:hypothetical protein
MQRSGVVTEEHNHRKDGKGRETTPKEGIVVRPQHRPPVHRSASFGVFSLPWSSIHVSYHEREGFGGAAPNSVGAGRGRVSCGDP